jgi:hypothetical protein
VYIRVLAEVDVAAGQREEGAGEHAGYRRGQVRGRKGHGHDGQRAKDRSRNADGLDVGVDAVPKVLQGVEERRVVVDLAEQDGLQRQLGGGIGESLVHPNRLPSQVPEAQGEPDRDQRKARGEKYGPGFRRERSAGCGRRGQTIGVIRGAHAWPFATMAGGSPRRPA